MDVSVFSIILSSFDNGIYIINIGISGIPISADIS